MSQEKANKLFDECITEMFRRVGLKYSPSYCRKHEWWRKRGWSSDEEKDFLSWMTKRFRKARVIRPDYEASMFLLHYGWITKMKTCKYPVHTNKDGGFVTGDPLATFRKFKTRYKRGFTSEEIDKLLFLYPNVSRKNFEHALYGVTQGIVRGQGVTYHCDVEKALLCGLEKRDLKSWEWD